MYNNMNHIMSKLAGISKFLLLGVLIILSGTVRAQDPNSGSYCERDRAEPHSSV